MHALMTYAWPGNIRELENIMKRFVVLQDEAIILNELAELAAQHAVPAAVPGSDRLDVVERHDELPSQLQTGVDLPAVARMAALRAERDVIDQALARFHWNRRKAAQYLNVSYKTLLNKIKECGIRETERRSVDA